MLMGERSRRRSLEMQGAGVRQRRAELVAGEPTLPVIHSPSETEDIHCRPGRLARSALPGIVRFRGN